MTGLKASPPTPLRGERGAYRLFPKVYDETMTNHQAKEPYTPLSPRRGGGGEAEHQYIDLYQQARQLICDHSVAPMNAVRDAAFHAFCRQGFPSRKMERYRYTDVASLFAPNYGLNLNRLPIPVNPYQAFRCDVPNLSTLLYFVVNDGFYSGEREGYGGASSARDGEESGERRAESGENSTLPKGVVIGSLAKNAHLIGNFYAQQASVDDDAVTALNTMLAQDGLLVYVPANTKVDKAIQVINILKAPSNLPPEGKALMVNRRVLIVLEEGAEASLLFCDHAADDCHFLATQVIEVYVGEGARLDLCCLEETHAKSIRVSNVYIKQEARSQVSHNIITLHNGITRNRLDVQLAGEDAECVCNGCAISDKEQHVDNNTLIAHHALHCTSRELYKYVLDERATGAFAGRVLVEHGAQKTSSEMRNQNICASREARMFTQPMLEIYADDVKCSHGSTVGQLNDAALFYMRQRGIGEREARLLLEQAFVGEVIDQIALTPLRDRLRYLVEKRFRGELNKCEGCKLCK